MTRFWLDVIVTAPSPSIEPSATAIVGVPPPDVTLTTPQPVVEDAVVIFEPLNATETVISLSSFQLRGR